MAPYSSRYHLNLNTGNLIEVAGVAMLVTALYLLEGLGWALLGGGIALIIGAELVYGASSLRIPLPRRPHPFRKIRRRH